MTEQIVFYNDSASAWEKALYAFLGEKQRRCCGRDTSPGRRSLVRAVALGLALPVAETQDATRWSGGEGRRQYLPHHQGLARCATIAAAMYDQRKNQ